MKLRQLCIAAACVAALSACIPPPVHGGGPGYDGGPDRRGGPDGQRDRGPGGGDARFARGDRLPDRYRGDGYVVNDWRGQGLQAPPEGHRWVRVGDEFLLVAVATGIISSILFLGGGGP
ncbi:MAG: RcnB family protein [Pseudoxanthomonas sp.]